MERHTCRASSTSIPSSHLNRLRRFTQLLIGKQCAVPWIRRQNTAKEGDWFEAGTKPLNQSEKGERGKPTIAERWALAKAGEYEQLPPENLKIYKYIHAMYRPVEDRDVLDNVGFVVLVAAEK